MYESTETHPLLQQSRHRISWLQSSSCCSATAILTWTSRSSVPEAIACFERWCLPRWPQTLRPSGLVGNCLARQHSRSGLTSSDVIDPHSFCWKLQAQNVWMDTVSTSANFTWSSAGNAGASSTWQILGCGVRNSKGCGVVTPATLRLSKSRTNPFPDSPPRNPWRPCQKWAGECNRQKGGEAKEVWWWRPIPAQREDLHPKSAAHGNVQAVERRKMWRGQTPVQMCSKAEASKSSVQSLLGTSPGEELFQAQVTIDQGGPPSGGSQTLVERSYLALLNLIRTCHGAAKASRAGSASELEEAKACSLRWGGSRAWSSIFFKGSNSSECFSITPRVEASKSVEGQGVRKLVSWPGVLGKQTEVSSLNFLGQPGRVISPNFSAPWVGPYLLLTVPRSMRRICSTIGWLLLSWPTSRTACSTLCSLRRRAAIPTARFGRFLRDLGHLYYVSLFCCSESGWGHTICQDSSESTTTAVTLICDDCCAYTENHKTWIPGVRGGNLKTCICQNNGNWVYMNW